ncbi:hypothetical protein FKP32DRAFT_1672848 [Trametes sanguinea]|nr:hypothetical protein FKP32DRAFT_1672848 [Trametes sanguinea]
MSDERSTRFNSLVEIMFLGRKLADDLMAPEACQAANSISCALAERMTSAIPRFLPEAHPDSQDRVVTMHDLSQCIERAGHNLEYAVKLVFETPQVQETMSLWRTFSFEYVNALRKIMMGALCSKLRTYLPSSEQVAMNVQSEINRFLAVLHRRTKSAILKLIQCNRRPFTMRIDELKEYTARFEQDHLAASAYLSCAKPDADDQTAYKEQIHVMAEVHAYLNIMCSRTCDTVVRAAWCELWDGFAHNFGDRIMDKASDLVDRPSEWQAYGGMDGEVFNEEA